MSRQWLRFVVLSMWLGFCGFLSGQWYAPYFSDTRSKIEPLMDVPLRDTAITRGDDGFWYLTGTPGSGPEGSDFQNNDGLYLWRSGDLETWEDLGQVWSLSADAAPGSWQREFRPNPENPDGPLVRGLTSPELHFFEGKVWVSYSMNGQGTGLMRADSPGGPWTDLGQITSSGRDASVFVEDDGTEYWVLDEGWIAPMNATRTGLAADPILLQPAPFTGATETQEPRRIGSAGATIHKVDGRYYLVAADMWDRLGAGCWDTFIAWSDNLMGPYGPRYLMTPHGGQVTLFEGPDGALCSTFAPQDSRAVFQDRPAWFELEWRGGTLYGASTDPFPRRPPSVVTEFGPWDRITPALDLAIRDLQFCKGEDGYYYLTGSGVDPTYREKIMLLRSTDLSTWEEVNVQFDYLSIPGTTEAMRQRRFEGRGVNDLAQYYMDSEVYALDGRFYIFTTLYDAGGLQPEDYVGSFLIRSTGSDPAGPYDHVMEAKSQSSLFVDDDGTRYLFYNGRLQELTPDLTATVGNAILLETEGGTKFTKGDVATNLTKILGKYVIFGTGWSGGNLDENFRAQDSTYDWYYWQSDTLLGPYKMVRGGHPLPHSGHSAPVLQGFDGRWYGCFFGNDSTSPWWNRPGILVYDVALEDDEIRIRLKDELP